MDSFVIQAEEAEVNLLIRRHRNVNSRRYGGFFVEEYRSQMVGVEILFAWYPESPSS
jgi:hypothetical protein